MMDKKTRVFCDNLCVLEKVFPEGINSDHYEIITDSPAIHSHLKAISTNDRVSPERLIALTKEIYELCVLIYEKLKVQGYEYDAYALMFTLTCEQNFLRRATTILDDDFDHPVIVAQAVSDQKNISFKNIISVLLENHPDCTTKTVPFSDLKIVDHYNFIHKKKKNKLLEFIDAFARNVEIYPLVTPLWPILKRLWSLDALKNKIQIGMIEENQTIRSICTGLSLRGIGFTFVKNMYQNEVKKNGKSFETKADHRFAEIEKLIGKDVSDFITRHTGEKVRASVQNYLMQKMKESYAQYYTAYRCSLGVIDRDLKTIKVVLSNMYKVPSEYGFVVACREKNIKLFTYQHGICREISPHFDYCPQITESNLPHYFITNTKKAAEVSKGYPFTKAQTIPIGITKDHYCGKSYKKSPDFPDVFYISTNVYSSDSGFIKAGADDRMSCVSEFETIQDILSKVNKDILYKTYPTQKYLDSDPCYAEVEKYNNLKMFMEDKDLRYISKYARVLISGKATSTFNWCFLTQKPMIFLDHPYLAPLRKELVPVFKEMLFYFDLTAPDTAQNMIDLLNQPIEKIEALYNAADKKAARDRFITEYYFDLDHKAEKRATDLMYKELKTSAK